MADIPKLPAEITDSSHIGHRCPSIRPRGCRWSSVVFLEVGVVVGLGVWRGGPEPDRGRVDVDSPGDWHGQVQVLLGQPLEAPAVYEPGLSCREGVHPFALAPPTCGGMTAASCDTVHVPLSSNTPPYRIDDVSDGDYYVRVRRRGTDVLALVPPGDGALGFRARLVAELQAYSTRSIPTRRYGTLLCILLFGVIPAVLLAMLGSITAGLFGFLEGSVLEDTMPVAILALLVGYGIIVVAPRAGLAHTITSATYPADPEDALRDLSNAGIRFLTEGDLRGGLAMETLRHDILVAPHTIRPEEWSALWVLAARDGLYGSALFSVQRLAELRLDESVRRRAWEFSVEMQVALDDLESATALVPPTSPGEHSDQEGAA